MSYTKAFRINQARANGWGERAEAFVDWMDALDRIVTKRLFVSIYDLPDWDFASAFESGQSAEDAAAQFIEDMEEEMGDLDDYL